jgi:hypothetical protein
MMELYEEYHVDINKKLVTVFHYTLLEENILVKNDDNTVRKNILLYFLLRAFICRVLYFFLGHIIKMVIYRDAPVPVNWVPVRLGIL